MADAQPFKTNELGFYLPKTPEIALNRVRIAGITDRDELMLPFKQWSDVLPFLSTVWQISRSYAEPTREFPYQTTHFRCRFRRDMIKENHYVSTARKQRQKPSRKLSGCPATLKVTVTFDFSRSFKGVPVVVSIQHLGMPHTHTLADCDISKVSRGVQEAFASYIVNGHDSNVGSAFKAFRLDDRSKECARHLGLTDPKILNSGTAHAWVKKHEERVAEQARLDALAHSDPSFAPLCTAMEYASQQLMQVMYEFRRVTETLSKVETREVANRFTHDFERFTIQELTHLDVQAYVDVAVRAAVSVGRAGNMGA